ncbi:glycosyltransferase family 2 protein [Leifsonia sp. AG29]|uniref:glycosyltransferase family 2 protein n=1 Tax=Leifsonia sp. AG29 TaxID=2598860 RepID=UPI00131BA06E|nr:glycosyltransferase family 2 protein [Leifsonia sp. AG29]
MSSAERPRTAVVTVTFNSNAVIDDFLRSIREDAGDTAEIVVVDNGTRDIEALRLTAERHGARLLELTDNLGYGGGMNAGIRTLGTDIEYVLVSNPDVRVARGTIGELVRLLDHDRRGAAAGPRVLNEDGTVYPSARRLPSLRTGVGHGLLQPIWASNPWTQRYHDTAGDESVRPSGWLSGSCLMVRRSAFDAIGGFDDGYFMYFEDVDLGLRFGRAGWLNLYDPAANVVHSGAHSTSERSAQMVTIHHDSAYRYLSKRYDRPWEAPLRWVLRVGLRLRLALVLRRAAGRSA